MVNFVSRRAAESVTASGDRELADDRSPKAIDRNPARIQLPACVPDGEFVGSSDTDAPNTSLGVAIRAWETLVTEFRALGGVAENIALHPTPTGRGLFPENPDKPVQLRVPGNLLFPPRNLALRGDSLRIEGTARKAPRSEEFFERYQAELSWGGRGHAQESALIDMFDSLEPKLRSMLAADFGMTPFIQGERNERILRYFLRGRIVRRHGEGCLAPFFDLMNRGSNGLQPTFGSKGGLQIEGKAEGEILLPYDYFDSLGIFSRHGTAVRREHAFSLPMHTKAGRFDLVIGRDPTAHTERPEFLSPQMRTEPAAVHLSYLTLGDANFPRMPRGIFYVLMREARIMRADDIFDRVLFVNKTKFLSLLGALEPHRGELVSRLRSMSHFQLAALAECLGAREL